MKGLPPQSNKSEENSHYKERAKNGSLKYTIIAILPMAPENFPSGKSADLPYPAGQDGSARQTASSLALLSLASSVGSPGAAVGASEQAQYV
jgi:hypothetical protein